MTKKKSEVQFKMAGLALAEVDSEIHGSAILSNVLDSLDADEILDEHTEDALKAAVADIEKAEAISEIYKDAEGDFVESSSADVPSEVVKTKPAKKAKAPKVAKEPKAPKEAKVKEPKAPRITSSTHLPGDRLVALLGGDKDFLAFDLIADSKEQAEKADTFISAMNTKGAIADKVKEKAILLLTWLKSGKDTSALNDVLRRSFAVLIEEGSLTSGKGGNLQTNLLAKPYSLGTAQSQSNQMFMLFPILGIATKEKGRLVANPQSTILALVKSKMA